ncbi:MAG: decarboxylating 6-phosphogluconate dehydrogenase [Gemmatimonadetes bacterium]|nr:decarboxylating 6-phosphogluconate dehydrogenase [Gemmatimonadota bacterium]
MTPTVTLGFQGLGKMGLSMVRRLRGGNHRVICLGRSPEKRPEVEAVGAEWAPELDDLIAELPSPRMHWMMVPAEAVDDVIGQVGPLLAAGDILIDGGNSHYKDTVRRAEALAADAIRYVDVGTSGGIWGLEVGYCLMVAGDREAFEALEPALLTLAPPGGCLYCGPSGAGHYVKMVHNGIEYGMMEAYAEGFELMAASRYDLPLREIAHLWNQGSVVRSWLLELAERALEEDPKLERLDAFVEDSGEGRWTAQEAVELAVPAPVIVHSLMRRFGSRQDNSFALRMLAALRRQFGGHAVKPAEGEGGA